MTGDNTNMVAVVVVVVVIVKAKQFHKQKKPISKSMPITCRTCY